MANSVYFLDTSEGVAHCAAQDLGSSMMVAVTAEALAAAGATDLACTAIAAYDDPDMHGAAWERSGMVPWGHAVDDLERELLRALAPDFDDGTGMLSGCFYQIAKSANAVRNRVRLLRSAIKALQPERVTIVETRIDSWFAHCGYQLNPWTIAIQRWAQGVGLPIDVVTVASPAHVVPKARPPIGPRHLAARVRAWARGTPLVRRVWLQRRCLQQRFLHSEMPRAATWRGGPLLFCDEDGYDWRYVQEGLRRKGARFWFIERDPRETNPTRFVFSPALVSSAGTSTSLGATLDKRAPAWTSRASAAFDSWLLNSEHHERLCIDDVETLQPLAPYLRRLVSAMPALTRYNDMAVRRALDRAKPSAVCFVSIAYAYQWCLVRECRRRGIPVLSYQHGGSYGTHEVATHDVLENLSADYFLAYGAGIEPSSQPILARRARYVAVGSALLDSRRNSPWIRSRAREVRTEPLRVLWAADVSMRNSITLGTEIEDTARYQIEQRCIALLARSSALRLTYRPFPGDLVIQGTPAWLSREHAQEVTVDSKTRFVDLLQEADLIVTLSSGGTLWNEAIAMGVPLVAFADPSRSTIRQSYIAAVAEACVLCTSEQSLVDEMTMLARDGARYLERFAGKNGEAFLKHYVVGESNVAERAIAFLEHVSQAH